MIHSGMRHLHHKYQQPTRPPWGKRNGKNFCHFSQFHPSTRPPWGKLSTASMTAWLSPPIHAPAEGETSTVVDSLSTRVELVDSTHPRARRGGNEIRKIFLISGQKATKGDIIAARACRYNRLFPLRGPGASGDRIAKQDSLWV